MARDGAKPRRRRLPRNAEAFREMALNYLGRFPTTTKRFEQYLNRKVGEAIREGYAEAEVANLWIAPLVARLTRLGLLDDARYAESRASVLHRRGRSRVVIQRDLRGRGVPNELIPAALESVANECEGDVQLEAAMNHARRKRLGPYDMTGKRVERRERHLASLARAGFSFSLARQIVDAETVEDILFEG
ncbi:MAG: regulatory protein [Myxococcota bacterium]